MNQPLPKRLTQDQAAQAATMLLLTEYGTDETVAAYLNDMAAFARTYQRPVWPSKWDGVAEEATRESFERWCWGTAVTG